MLYFGSLGALMLPEAPHLGSKLTQVPERVRDPLSDSQWAYHSATGHPFPPSK